MKDFGIVLIYSVALFIAVKFFWKWVTGGFNSIAVWEWINRGFSFALGMVAAFVIITMIIKLFDGG